MPYKVMLDGPDIKLNATCSTLGLTVDTPELGSLVKMARGLNTAVAMKKIRFDKKGTGDFDYELEAVDGRLWKQIIVIDNSDALMNFDVEDYWRLSEFIAHRNVRDIVIGLVSTHSLTKLTLDWI